MALQGVATAMVQPVSMAYVGDLTPKGKEGAYAGYVNTAFLGGVAGGPILGGVIKDLFNMQASFILLGILSLLSLLLLLFFLPEVQKHHVTEKKEIASWRTVLSSRPILGVALFRVVYALSSTLIWVFVPLLSASPATADHLAGRGADFPERLDQLPSCSPRADGCPIA